MISDNRDSAHGLTGGETATGFINQLGNIKSVNGASIEQNDQEYIGVNGVDNNNSGTNEMVFEKLR